MVTPPIVVTEMTRREGATDRRRVSPCTNGDSYACGSVVPSESFCGFSGFRCSAMTWLQRSRRSVEIAFSGSVRWKSDRALCRKEEM